MTTVDLSDWCKNLAPLKIRNAVVKIAFELDKGMVTMSPVGDPSKWLALRNGVYVDYESVHGIVEDYTGGRFRANWQVGINHQPQGETGRIDESRAGTQTLAVNLASLGSYQLGDTIYILNNVPYAERLENGWSHQAPVGMVGVTVARLDEFVRTATGGA